MILPTSPRGNQPTSLIAATTDPHRRVAESGIRAPKDKVILVEGRTDEMALKKHCSFDGITFKAIGKGEGKKEIVHQVSVHPDYMGLVDMDCDRRQSRRTGEQFGRYTRSMLPLNSYPEETRGLIT